MPVEKSATLVVKLSVAAFTVLCGEPNYDVCRKKEESLRDKPVGGIQRVYFHYCKQFAVLLDDGEDGEQRNV